MYCGQFGQHQAHTVAAAHAEPHQHAREPLDLLRQLAVGEALAEERGGRPDRPSARPRPRGASRAKPPDRAPGTGAHRRANAGATDDGRSCDRIIGAMSVVTQTDAAPGAREDRGLFRRGGQLVQAYIRMHPKPFAVGRHGLDVVRRRVDRPDHGARARDRPGAAAVVQPGRSTPTPSGSPSITLVVCGTLRAVGIGIRRYFSGVSGERVMATLRRRSRTATASSPAASTTGRSPPASCSRTWRRT